MSPRWAATVPSLARLLSDLPPDRLKHVLMAWGGDESGGSAALYRRMTTSEVARVVRDGLCAEDRLLFDTLLASRSADRQELGRRLPFGDDELLDRLARLEGQGLIWRLSSARESGERTGWFVATDLANALARRPSSGQFGMTPPTPPAPVPLASEPAPAARFGQVLAIIGSAAGSEGPAPYPAVVQNYARHSAVSLGVWTEDARPGHRYEAWRRLADGLRVRALARLWFVDDEGPVSIPETIRHALWDTAATLIDQRWYSLDEVARVVAWEIGRTGSSTRVVAREQLEAAVWTLVWLGVLQVALDHRERPQAVRVTSWGADALS